MIRVTLILIMVFVIGFALASCCGSSEDALPYPARYKSLCLNERPEVGVGVQFSDGTTAVYSYAKTRYPVKNYRIVEVFFPATGETRWTDCRLFKAIVEETDQPEELAPVVDHDSKYLIMDARIKSLEAEIKRLEEEKEDMDWRTE